jgi:Flp pilus assembly protein TadB
LASATGPKLHKVSGEGGSIGSGSMTTRDVEEYKALRATIRERGTMRLGLFFAVVVAWAAGMIATAALAALPVATLLPLLVLASGFEAVFALHTGVERIGRYLQVFHAPSATEPDWERTVMAFGQANPGAGSDALFSPYFFFATVLNFVPVLLAEPVRLEVSVVGVVHLLFLGRLVLARRASGRQRALDLERFQRIEREWSGPAR